MLEQIRQDLRYCLRQLRRTPVVTLVASLSIAIAIGVVVIAFGLLNNILFRPVPLPDASRIHHVYASEEFREGQIERYGSSSYEDYLEYERSGAFGTLTAFTSRPTNVAITGRSPEMRWIGFVAPNYFDALGVRLMGGVPLSRDGEEPRVVITHAYWERAFERDPAAIGQVVRLNGTAFTITGIAPPRFVGIGDKFTSVGWVPISFLPTIAGEPDVLKSRVANWGEPTHIAGRLRDGQQAADAAARLNAVARALAERDPEGWRDAQGKPRIVSLLTQRQSRYPPGQREELFLMVGTLSVLVLLVILLATTNVAGLMLARAVARQHEIAIRLTLGASRLRLMSQLLTESVLLALIGGALGVLVVTWGLDILATRINTAGVEVHADWRVLLVALLASLVCAVLFGFAPAHQSVKADLRSALSNPMAAGGLSRMRGALIALQVTVACVLLVLSTNASRGVIAHLRDLPDIDTDGLLVASLHSFGFGRDTVREKTYVRQVREAAATFPGVQFATTSSYGALDGHRSVRVLPTGDRSLRFVSEMQVAPDFFETLRITPVKGRVFSRADYASSAPVAVVNRTFERLHRPNAIGHLINVGQQRGVEIIGVINDVAAGDDDREPKPMIYVIGQGNPLSELIVRTESARALAIATALRGRIAELFPDQVAPPVRSIQQIREARAGEQRTTGQIALLIGVLELALATVGLYGLLLYALLARTREVGIRLALGAAPAQASWAVIRSGLRYAMIGAVYGLLLSVPAAIVAGNLMVGARATDPVPFIAALVCVLVAGAAAAYSPLRRAARISPSVALRYE